MAVLEIKKSKFISYAFNIKSNEEALRIINKIKQENRKATHICYAYRITESQIFEKAYDDKEPSGTAGKPILSVIQKQNLNNTLVIVIRFFGGIKLGSGGLIRAYGKSAALAIAEIN